MSATKPEVRSGGGHGVAAGLAVSDLTAGYLGVPAVREATLRVLPGELVALLGPNGAGKTTLLSAISGLIEPMSGHVSVAGADATGQPAHVLARRGIALVPEGRALFPSLTVHEHLRLVPGRRSDAEEKVLDILPELRKCLGRRVGLLSGGEQQMLAIGRALVSKPHVLLVDEMSLGLAPVVVQRLLPLLRHAADELRTAVLVVEQHVSLVIAAADLLEKRDLVAASYLGDQPQLP